MRGNECLGIIFANVGDENLPELTSFRTTGSVPFGGRYRLIDFTLSNMVHSGICNIGVVTKSNYRSLFEHLGNGKPWDLARKRGGLHLLSPFAYAEYGLYRNRIDALYSNLSYIEHSPQTYVLLADCDMVANIDLDDMFTQHQKTGADITVAYVKGHGSVCLKIDRQQRITDIDEESENVPFGYVLMAKDLLASLARRAMLDRKEHFYNQMLKDVLPYCPVYGYEVGGYAAKISDIQSYYQTSMQLLDSEVRNQVFAQERPILTKLHDDMPCRCGFGSKVSNSLIADGCVIEGEVKNSIIFRGVKVKSGAIVENCVLMQSVTVGENARMRYVVADKNTQIRPNHTMIGSLESVLFAES